MAVNKVVYNKKVLIDLTTDTITPEYLFWKHTAHQANGQKINGTLFENWPQSQSFLETLEDSSGNAILDSDGNQIYGQIIYRKL